MEVTGGFVVTFDVVVAIPVVTTLGGFVDVIVSVVVSSFVDVSAVVNVATSPLVVVTIVVVVTVVGLGIVTVLDPDDVVEGFNDELVVILGVISIVVEDQVEVGSVFEKYIPLVNLARIITF